MRKFLKDQKALGLVEALVALAVIATGMVVITSLSLKTIKQARKNEMQDVSIQTAVEAMDFMKQPGVIQTTVGKLPNPTGRSYRLNLDSLPYLIYVGDGTGEINNCTKTSPYYVSDVSDFLVCQQIIIKESAVGRYTIKVVVVWQTVGGDFEKRTFDGFRYGNITEV